MTGYVLAALLLTIIPGGYGNLPPLLTADMGVLVLNESVPVGTVVYQLMAQDPEGSPVTFHLQGTDKLSVDPQSGIVTLVKPLDYESGRELRVVVLVEDVVESGAGAGDGDTSNNVHGDAPDNNVVKSEATIVITDVNDNPPQFINGPYSVNIKEDTPVGTIVFDGVRVIDPDTVGEELDVTCSSLSNPPHTCDVFSIAKTSSNESFYHGVISLTKRLDYATQQFYQMILLATDGAMENRIVLDIHVEDVQNSPPVFDTSLVAVIKEDAEIGSHVMTVQAHDGDLGHPRDVQYQLVTNPHEYFLLDARTGNLTVAKQLDKEAITDTNGILTFQIRAYEVEDGVRVGGAEAMRTKQATVTIQDVNDEPPRFNQREFSVEIPENLAADTPLPRLDMTVSDPDVGPNSAFTLSLADASDIFAVSPAEATGSTAVSIRLANKSLDFENPNQKKFIIRVVAEESKTKERRSSTATLTVTVTDTNDNPPTFPYPDYSATVNEAATAGTLVTAITAMDRDSGLYGAESIVYRLDGSDAERFAVDKKEGVITVAACDTPGVHPCLDLETKPEYHLTYTATDKEGTGLSVQVPLKITLLDANDNAPRMVHKRYRTAVEEGARELQPPLIIGATDADNSSEVEYKIVGGNELELFQLDPHSGQITIAKESLDLTYLNTSTVNLIVEATDGKFSDNATVSISIQDVNNNAPEFTMPTYTNTVNEDSPLGTLITQVSAHDGDTGDNAAIHYQIQSGGFNDFALNETTGWLSLASHLDYDRRDHYSIVVVAVDGGLPPQTGTSTIQMTVINSNDKAPVLSPVTQRTNVNESVPVGAVIYKLQAVDPDAQTGSLQYEVVEPITAIDTRGHPVPGDKFKEWFKVDPMTGEVFVGKVLERELAAVITLSIVVRDTSAPNHQQGNGNLVVTIIDVNDHPPTFLPPWTVENPTYELSVPEGWSESPVATFTATDKDSSIAYYAIIPPSESFSIDNTTGVVRLRKELDYEKDEKVQFTVWAFDTGIPQFSSSALVTVTVTNTNDNSPVFSQNVYQAAIDENSAVGSYVTNVSATDHDNGEFGQITYSLIGTHAALFSIGPQSGEIRVLNSTGLDREARQNLSVEVVATDGGPNETRRRVTALVEIKLLDLNDNEPVFPMPFYAMTVPENLGLNPHILQTKALDPDFGENGTLTYSIIKGNHDDVFRIDPDSGIMYAAKSLRGVPRIFSMVVEARDGGNRTGVTNVEITVDTVNENKPIFTMPKAGNETVMIPENEAFKDYLVMTVLAKDLDSGDNGHLSYHFNVDGVDVQDTDEFNIDPETGELRLRVPLDRETKAKYDILLKAKDHGTPSYETLQLLSIELKDANDNEPMFQESVYDFLIDENNDIGVEVGRVHAHDLDEGEHARVFYHILAGNDDLMFRMDRLSGVLYANASLDRETQSIHTLYIKATNSPDVFALASRKRDVLGDANIAKVRVTVQDENDNPPSFPVKDYFVGVKSSSILGELLTHVVAEDPDEGLNGSIEYLIQASNLYKSGSLTSSGSVIPSPFNISREGKIVTAGVMAEYTQDRFQLTVIAREVAPPKRAAYATIYVWVYEPNQLIRVVLSRRAELVHRERKEIVDELSNVTRSLVVVDDVRYHVDDQKHIHRDWTDMYMHVVDQQTHSIRDTMEVLKSIDAQYDYLKDRYSGFAIEHIVPAVQEVKEESFDTALAALVALLIVLFVGCVTFLVVCCCLRNWMMALPNKGSMKKKDALIKQAILEELHTTENPLWMEQKLKLYEEQELTMQVFIDELRHAEDSASQHEDNTYATIQNPHHGGADDMGDYETLTTHRQDSQGSVRSRPQPGQLGFHGSTFQPPLL